MPDLIIIYCKPTRYGTTVVKYDTNPLVTDYATENNDWLLTINSINMTINNKNGCLDSYSAQELHAMSIRNGLSDDWATFSGQAKTLKQFFATDVGGLSNAPEEKYVSSTDRTCIPTMGTILCIRPSDLGMSEIAKGCNWTIWM